MRAGSLLAAFSCGQQTSDFIEGSGIGQTQAVTLCCDEILPVPVLRDLCGHSQRSLRFKIFSENSESLNRCSPIEQCYPVPDDCGCPPSDRESLSVAVSRRGTPRHFGSAHGAMH